VKDQVLEMEWNSHDVHQHAPAPVQASKSYGPEVR
jgi:hypothetical protein